LHFAGCVDEHSDVSFFFWQAVPDQRDFGTQTDWKYPRNANTQYYPREFSALEIEQIEKSEVFTNAVKSSERR
jgi:hypothetical protein